MVPALAGRQTMRGRSRSAVALAWPAVVALCACGPSPQAEPAAIELVVPAAPTSGAPAPDGPRPLTVYLVEGDRLVPVERSGTGTGLDTVLDQLLAGPTSGERRSGARSVVAPRSLELVRADPVERVAVIEVSDEFAATSGSDQLLAVAQVVWTATGPAGGSAVSLTKDGEALEVPTDDGLSSDPVQRQDFGSVAPLPGPTAGTGG